MKVNIIGMRCDAYQQSIFQLFADNFTNNARVVSVDFGQVSSSTISIALRCENHRVLSHRLFVDKKELVAFIEGFNARTLSELASFIK